MPSKATKRNQGTTKRPGGGVSTPPAVFTAREKLSLLRGLLDSCEREIELASILDPGQLRIKGKLPEDDRVLLARVVTLLDAMQRESLETLSRLTVSGPRA